VLRPRFGIGLALFGLLSAGAAPAVQVGTPVAPAPQQARADPAPPSVTFGALFERVALSTLFDDGKLWADMEPRRSPAAIMQDYRARPPRDERELKRFVEANFREPDAPPLRQPTPGLPLLAHIAELWPLLTRHTPTAPAHSTLLPLPRAYVVPGGRFREIYYWDSYFTMLGLDGPHRRLRDDMVANFGQMIRRYGHVPNGSRSYYLSRSQPPFFYKMVELTDPERPARAFAAHLSDLRAEHRFWMEGGDQAKPGMPVRRVVRMPDGSLLNRYWDDRDVPRDESFAADVATWRQSGRRPAILYRDLRASAESGWDFSSRWFADGKTLASIRTTEIVPPDLNALLYGLEHAILLGCREVRDRLCVQQYSRQAEDRRKAMRTYLWNDRTGLFDDYHWPTGRLVGNVSAAALYPLFAKVATDAQARRTAVTVERELLKPGGLVSTNRRTGQQWDAPNGWAPLQWVAVDGLRAYGHHGLARTIGQRWLRTVATVYAGTGKLLEKYDVVTARPGGGGEYPLQDGFGWTNGVTVALARLYGLPQLAAPPRPSRRGRPAAAPVQ